ncbi:MAG: hypothetical protein AAFS10_20880, partial [Myxococcota bacterium]
MIICPKCNKESADEAWHCGYCGAKLRGRVTSTMFGMAIPQDEVERLREMHAARSIQSNPSTAAAQSSSEAPPGGRKAKPADTPTGKPRPEVIK